MVDGVGWIYGLDVFALLRANTMTTITNCYLHSTQTCEPYCIYPELTAVRSTYITDMDSSQCYREALAPISRAMPAASEEGALTESGNPDCGLRGWTFSNDRGKCPTPTRGLLVPDTCTFVYLGLRIFMVSVFFPAHVQTPLALAGPHPTCTNERPEEGVYHRPP